MKFRDLKYRCEKTGKAQNKTRERKLWKIRNVLATADIRYVKTKLAKITTIVLKKAGRDPFQDVIY